MSLPFFHHTVARFRPTPLHTVRTEQNPYLIILLFIIFYTYHIFSMFPSVVAQYLFCSLYHSVARLVISVFNKKKIFPSSRPFKFVLIWTITRLHNYIYKHKLHNSSHNLGHKFPPTLDHPNQFYMCRQIVLVRWWFIHRILIYQKIPSPQHEKYLSVAWLYMNENF